MKNKLIIKTILMVMGSLLLLFNSSCNSSNPKTIKEGPAKTETLTPAPSETTTTETGVETEQGGSDTDSKKYIVYYFYGTKRCPTCQKIEKYAYDTIHDRFADENRKGLVQWQAVNIDEPENKHFVEDFQLFTRSVVIEELQGGKRAKWKNLDKIWEHVRNESDFSSYVEKECREFMEGSDG